MRNRSISLSSRVLTSGRGVFATTVTGAQITASGSWNSVYNYLQRDIIALKSQFTAGDSNTPSDVFDSVPFRGLQLTSDDQMQPNSQRGYAPTIRGIARSNAQVIVRQNGYIAYQTAVSPGEFEINDMFPTGSNGDYDVTVKKPTVANSILSCPTLRCRFCSAPDGQNTA